MARTRPLPTALLLVLLPVLACAATPPLGSTPYKRQPGPFSVAVALYDWVDTARDRPVPVKVYYPATGPGPFPLVVFSHGLGGSRDTYEYLGRHWASHGYVVVHVQHLGSDEAVWKEADRPLRAMRRAVMNPKNAFVRPEDVHFVLDRMTELAGQKGPFKGRLDLRHVGMAGHSFGAWTTLAVAGQRFPPLAAQAASAADPRVTAAIEMSAPTSKWSDPDQSYGAIRIPMFHLTGTRDALPFNLGQSPASDRRIPYDHIRGADQYLVTFAGGDHMAFAMKRMRGGPSGKDAHIQDLTRQATTAFWDAYLRQDADARRWLTEGGLETELAANGKLEEKLAAQR
jgi:predicted dienelactone hydrolase